MSKTTEISPPYTFSEVTPKALGSLAAVMYQQGSDTVTADEMSNKWPSIHHEFQAATSNWSAGTILDLNRSSVVQGLATMVTKSLEWAEGEGLLNNTAMTRLKSHAQARLCSSKIIKNSLLSTRLTPDTSALSGSVSFQKKDIQDLLIEVYGENTLSFFSRDPEVMEHLDMIKYMPTKFLKEYTNKAYEEYTGKAMPTEKADRETIIWCTKDGRRALVKATRQVMEDLIRHGMVDKEVVNEHGSHEAAEEQALKSLGLWEVEEATNV